MVAGCKKSEAAGWNRSEVLQAALESLGEGLVVVDQAGCVILSNPAAAPLFQTGLAPAQPDRLPHGYELYLPDMTIVCPADRLPLARALRGEAVERVEVFAKLAGARKSIWLVVSARPVRDSWGGPMGAIAVLHAVTESRQSEACCRNEEYFRALIENALDLISVLDTNGAICYVSPSFERVLGYRPEELIGQSAFDRVHSEDLPAVRRAFEAAVADSLAGAWAEFRYRHRDGSWRVFEGVAKKLPGGTSTRVAINTRDITERKRAEEHIRFQASVLDQVRKAVIAIDTDGRIIYWNQFAEKLYQWKREEVFGKRTRDVTFPLASVPQFEAALRQVCERGYYEGELTKRRKDGTTFPASVTATTVRDDRGATIGFVAITADVTERKRDEARLRESSDRLRTLAARLQRVREMERALISRELHDDLVQPLAALNIGLSEITSSLSSGDSPALVAGLATRVSSLLQRMIESLQKISSELRPSLLDTLGLGAAIESYAREFQSRTGLRCAIVGSANDVCAAPDVSLAVYRILQEALNNIARHAGATQVRIRLRQRGRRLVLEVRDNGRGIGEREIAAGGSLGLLEMRERALLIGGEITLCGAPGQGTSVCLTVPARRNVC